MTQPSTPALEARESSPRSSRGAQRLATRALLAGGLALAGTGLFACSGGGDTEVVQTGDGGIGASTMAVVKCTLGCNNGLTSGQVSCGTLNIFVNQEIVVDFSQDVDISTVNKNTFQVVEVATGKAPTGSFSLDPDQPFRLIFRPQLTFNSAGNPIFGLNAGESYTIRIPGQAQDPPPYIRSVTGANNQQRLQCTVAATEGIVDPVPGAPTVEVFVDVVTSYDSNGDPATILTNQPADGAENVFRDSKITLRFDDIMNPATLVNPVSGESDFITVSIDPDGNVLDSSDQLAVEGTFGIVIGGTSGSTSADPVTTVTFTPDNGFPSAGTGALPRQVVVSLPSAIVDLGGNALTNPGLVVFTPEVLTFDPIALPDGGEQFDGSSNIDSVRSGTSVQGGLLVPGISGGSGFLGDLIVDTGETLVLCTDADCSEVPEAVSMFTGVDVLPLDGAVLPNGDPGMFTVTDGIFEFSSVTVRAGATLIFVGENPARLFARGEMLIQGLVDVSGAAPPDNEPNGHSSSDLVGGDGGLGGPSGGNGGRGGDWPDSTGNLELLGANGVPNPDFLSLDGETGGPVGGVASFQGGGGLGAGPGSVHWPEALPTGVDVGDFGDVEFSNLLTCSSDQVAAGGGGGAYATDGGGGLAIAPVLTGFPGPAIPTPPTAGGASADIGLTDTVRTLDPELGFLRGGAGGGGGGMSVHLTRTNGSPLQCTIPIGGAPELLLFSYIQHSGAGGGGAGGAIQLNAGNLLRIEDQVLARGGDGGNSFLIFTPGSGDTDRSAAPGGAGAGGAVLAQAPNLQLGGTPGRIDVTGGEGGFGPGTTFEKSRGGDGGTGLVRLESSGLSAENEAPKIFPFDLGEPDSATFLSVGTIATKNSGPSAFSGMTSCWTRPEGTFFSVQFKDDVLDEFGDIVEPGWDMIVRFSIPGLEETSFRLPNDFFGGLSMEESEGTNLKGADGAPIVVRFQGVRVVGDIIDLCDVALDGSEEGVVLESLTNWVEHPAELNTYWDFLGPEVAAQRQPNAVRYQIIFDRSNALLPEVIDGVESISILAQPD